MTQSNHTPGPWHVEAEIVDGQVKYSIDQETVYESGDIERGEVKANCNLIAAAPQLLEALTIMRDDWLTAFDTDVMEGDTDAVKIINMVDMAIAKATGK